MGFFLCRRTFDLHAPIPIRHLQQYFVYHHAQPLITSFSAERRILDNITVIPK